MTHDALISQVPNLPVPRPAVARLLNLLTDPDTDNDTIVGILKPDAVLSAKVLALCNSASFGLPAPVSSLEQAMMYLGHSQIHRLVMAISFGGALAPSLPGYAIEAGGLWQHSLLTALISESVLRLVKTEEGDTSVAYTAGLIHDLGKLVISHALDQERQEAVHALIRGGNCSLIEAEREIIGADHAEIGAHLLGNWNLPEVLLEAVANHHQPAKSRHELLASVVHLADVIAHQVGSSPGFESFAVRAEESAVKRLGLTAEHMDGLMISAYDSVFEVQETLAAI